MNTEGKANTKTGKKFALPPDAMFSQRALLALMFPLIIEQLLNSLIGTADTMMVSNVGSAAISAASLVDSINNLVLQVFTAMAVGGTVVCSQYLGRKDNPKANESARQVLLSTLVIALVITVVCVGFRGPLLRLIFGSVEPEVMADAESYFFYTGLSYPFIALYNTAAAVYRSEGNSRLPMGVSMTGNLMNIVGNAILIFAAGMGIAGAGLATLISRIFIAFTMLYFLRRPGRVMVVNHYAAIRPNFSMIAAILTIGVPNGIENGMFQFGKLAIQSSVSTMGTTAIAAQAMANIMENLNGIAPMGMGIGLMTVVGQCIGAGRKDEAVYYIRKVCVWAEICLIISCVLVYLAARPVTVIAAMEPESAALCVYMVGWITVCKPIFWVGSFIPGYGMRAAGDVKFSMIVSTITMWLCRVSLCIFLVRVLHFGPMAVWIGMFTDWGVRSIIFFGRFHSRKWLEHRVVA